MAQEKKTKTKNNNEEMLRSGSFWTLVGKLCVPAILIMLVMVLYHMADVFFIGQTGDANKVAAVTLGLFAPDPNQGPEVPGPTPGEITLSGISTASACRAGVAKSLRASGPRKPGKIRGGK